MMVMANEMQRIVYCDTEDDGANANGNCGGLAANKMKRSKRKKSTEKDGRKHKTYFSRTPEGINEERKNNDGRKDAREQRVLSNPIGVGEGDFHGSKTME